MPQGIETLDYAAGNSADHALQRNRIFGCVPHVVFVVALCAFGAFWWYVATHPPGNRATTLGAERIRTSSRQPDESYVDFARRHIRDVLRH